MAISKKTQATINSVLDMNAPTEQVGLGVDLVEVDRMREIMSRTPNFKERIFSKDEIAYCDKHPDPAINYAARFAAKEATLKALGTGFSQGVGFKDVEVVREKGGRPTLALHGRASEIADELGVTELPLSLSHTKNDAIACVIAITKGATAAAKNKVDPAQELAKQFKEAKVMLDDIGNRS